MQIKCLASPRCSYLFPSSTSFVPLLALIAITHKKKKKQIRKIPKTSFLHESACHHCHSLHKSQCILMNGRKQNNRFFFTLKQRQVNPFHTTNPKRITKYNFELFLNFQTFEPMSFHFFIYLHFKKFCSTFNYLFCLNLTSAQGSNCEE